MPVVPTTGTRLLVEMPADTLPPPTSGLEAVFAGPAAGDVATGWVAASPSPARGSPHPWDEAHRAVADPRAAGLESLSHLQYAEPDLLQHFPYQVPDTTPEALEARALPCQYRGLDSDWPPAELRFAWHLDDAFSGLRAARQRVGEPAGRRVRIAHLDTGYDPEHITRPLLLRTEEQRNFAGGDANDATDPARHFPLDNPGHGTATLALLAGCRVQWSESRFDDFLGGAPQAEVVPVRIANSVIHFLTSSMARGIEYAIEAGCDVVSVSMGGVPARAWATAVNRAYEAGVAIFAAAGNRIGISPPVSIVYPARFNRVTAVCGVMADRKPYYRPGLHRLMQGCFGPPGKMVTALAAYTPNMPWAVLGCSGLITHDGAGTSSATPQAAAAAALWLQQANVPADVEPWQKVEAVFHALFASADRDVPDRETYFGQGLLRALQALDVPFRDDLPMAEPDVVSFPWLRLLGALEAAPADVTPPGRDLMYEVEALQIFEQSPRLQQLAGGADPLRDDPPLEVKKQVLRGLQESPLASDALRAHVAGLLKNR
jgi:hypothetical protein